MKLIINFFDKEEWSLYATLQTIIILVILKLNFKNDLKNINLLTFASLLGMMNTGEILPRVIFTSFLSLLLFFNKKYFVINTILACFGSFILSLMFKYKNKITNVLIRPYFKYAFILGIIIWFIFFIYSIIKFLIETYIKKE